ncbi:MAG: sensor histidine kinase [Gemmatimonadales bacterium]
MSEPRYVSLRLRFIAAMVAMLLFVVLAFGVIAYQAVRRSAKEAGLARLQSVARQFVSMASPGFASAQARLTRLGQDSTLIAGMRLPNDSARLASTLRTQHPELNATTSITLRNPAGHTVAEIGPPVPRPAGALAYPDSTATMPLFVASDTVFLENSAPIRDGDVTLGYIVQTQRLVAAAAAVNQLTSLIGPNAVLLLGNHDGSAWTDLMRVVHRPPPVMEGREYSRDSQRRLAVSHPFPAAPLVVAVEMPADEALAPARVLIQTFLAIGLLVVALGAVIAWLVSRTITGPLESLTSASQAIAAGGSVATPLLPVTRHDEIGVLARSFTTMADQVRRGIETLESQVATRTTQLTEALARLEAAQKDLIRKERLATLGQVSSSVGHELRNPLGVMTNAVYYLETTQREAPPKVREYLGIIRSQIRISEKIVSDLLDHARIKPPQRSTVAVRPFVEEALSRVTVPPSVTLVKHLDDAPMILIDGVQVGQVIINLVTNAIQAMEPDGGTLTVGARVDGNLLALQVTDTGSGISEESREHIFEPLFTTKARGIGLGLAVSRGLARANNGDLSFESVLGRGTTFTLHVPIASS